MDHDGKLVVFKMRNSVRTPKYKIPAARRIIKVVVTDLLGLAKYQRTNQKNEHLLKIFSLKAMPRYNRRRERSPKSSAEPRTLMGEK